MIAKRIPSILPPLTLRESHDDMIAKLRRAERDDYRMAIV
jgi:hypothetical protein